MSNNSGSIDPEDSWDNPLQVLHKTQPPYFHQDYLHLVDLNNFIKSIATQDAVTILDYGAGSSPYKQYFPNADYRRADITGAKSLQYHIKSDSTISESDETFDLILSTQVAEHVPDPKAYFMEAFRLLKPGGQFVLTTHGVWEEHGSPYDFQRWTAMGLRRDLAKAGFKQLAIYKLTCGLRAAYLLMTVALYGATAPDRLIPKLFFKCFRWLYSRLLPLIHRIFDSGLAQDMIFEDQEKKSGPALYIVIAAIAKK